MHTEGSHYPPWHDPFIVMRPADRERNPQIQELIAEFQSLLPPHFDQAHFFFIDHPTLASVIRANCTNDDCGTRAIIHMQRDDEKNWHFTDTLHYDRQEHAICVDCQKQFSQAETTDSPPA